MKLRLVVLFYNDRCIQKEEEQKLIHGEKYELPFSDYSKRTCIFYNVDVIYSCERDENYSCIVSGGQTFVVCMPIEKLEDKVEKAKIKSLLNYSIQ